MAGHAELLSRPEGAAGVQPRPSVLRDVAEMWRFAHRVGIARDLKVLYRTHPVRSVAAAAGEWAPFW
jgi:hypothetical protein